MFRRVLTLCIFSTSADVPSLTLFCCLHFVLKCTLIAAEKKAMWMFIVDGLIKFAITLLHNMGSYWKKYGKRLCTLASSWIGILTDNGLGCADSFSLSSSCDYNYWYFSYHLLDLKFWFVCQFHVSLAAGWSKYYLKN